MNKAIFATILCCFAFFTLASGAVNFPYPQEASYGYGTINTTSTTASADLKNKFSTFFTDFYEEGTCSNKFQGPCARIKHDTKSNTVSEGIGYGMIMAVYFSNETTSYQNQFDKLWAYYQNWTNNKGVMNWKINGFSKVDAGGTNGATDAEFDVALALAMAHYQFGSTANKNYLDTAKALIAKIRQYEIDPNNLHRPGDGWNSERNPSYVSPAAFEIFKEVESDQASKWESVISANYELLKKNQNSSSGVFSDWCNDNGGVTRGTFSYDAIRVPWRIAWANAWYGHADAKTLLTNLFSKFLSGKNAADIKGSISLTGTMGNDKNSTFVGPLTNALSYNSANQTQMDSFWNVLIGFKNEPYYSAALQIITGLLATGNMPNLKALAEAPSSSSVPSSSSEEAPSSSSSSEDETPIVLPQIVHSNSLNAMQNSVNLQVVRNASLKVFDLKGNMVRSLKFTQGSYIVSLGDLPKGLYIVKAQFGSQKEILRIPVR